MRHTFPATVYNLPGRVVCYLCETQTHKCTTQVLMIFRYIWIPGTWQKIHMKLHKIRTFGDNTCIVVYYAISNHTLISIINMCVINCWLLNVTCSIIHRYSRRDQYYHYIPITVYTNGDYIIWLSLAKHGVLDGDDKIASCSDHNAFIRLWDL
jgi:hypothetical protein